MNFHAMLPDAFRTRNVAMVILTVRIEPMKPIVLQGMKVGEIVVEQFEFQLVFGSLVIARSFCTFRRESNG